MAQTPLIGGIPQIASNVAAGGVTVVDTGGYYTGTTLEEILAELGTGASPGAFLTVVGGGKGTVQSLGSLGSSETINLANANYFAGTLNAACSISFTGWTNGKDCQIIVETTQDGTGGWAATFTGITWPDGIAPTPDTTAGTVAMYAFLSRDGGTTIYGFLLGGTGGTSSGEMVPYLIESGETFTVPVKKQALWADPITVDAGGALVVDGRLLMVN